MKAMGTGAKASFTCTRGEMVMVMVTVMVMVAVTRMVTVMVACVIVIGDKDDVDSLSLLTS